MQVQPGWHLMDVLVWKVIAVKTFPPTSEALPETGCHWSAWLRTPSVTSPNWNHTSLYVQTLTRATHNPTSCQHGGKRACLFLVLHQTSVYRPNFPSDLSLHWYDGGKQQKEEIRGIGLFLHHHLRFSVKVKKMRPGPSEACSISCLSQFVFITSSGASVGGRLCRAFTGTLFSSPEFLTSCLFPHSPSPTDVTGSISHKRSTCSTCLVLAITAAVKRSWQHVFSEKRHRSCPPALLKCCHTFIWHQMRLLEEEHLDILTF